jgi:acyl-CoA synthetase (AMP-forming)/AMP-acid ligase II
MKVKLKARGLWSVVQKKGGDEMEDMMALDVLASAVPSEMVATVASKDSAKEAWEEIRTLRVGNERVRAATAQQLLRRFENVAIQEEESIEDYSLRLSGMV